jgi:hypothetical protein
MVRGDRLARENSARLTGSPLGPVCYNRAVLSGADLEVQLENVRAAPLSARLELIVVRPTVGTREFLEAGVLDVADGLVGDSWKDRPDRHTPDNAPDPNRQVSLMSVRAASLLCGPRERWPLTGTQLFIDLNLAMDVMPASTRLSVGGAILELTAKVNPGCRRFTGHFGDEARKLVKSPAGLALNLRGRFAQVVQSGQIQLGDWVTPLGQDAI